MIPWYKSTMCELRAVVNLPRAMRMRFIAAREIQLVRELETLPNFTQDELNFLERVGVETKLENLCSSLLSARNRKEQYKASVKEKVERSENVPGTLQERSKTSLVEKSRVEKSRKDESKEEEERESTREIAAAPPAPSAKPKRAKLKATSFDGWTPKPEHGELAKERGVNLDEQLATMRDWIKASGKTYKDYDAFARNWLRRSKPDAVPFKAKSNGALTFGDNAPANAGLDYWMNSDHSRPPKNGN